MKSTLHDLIWTLFLKDFRSGHRSKAWSKDNEAFECPSYPSSRPLSCAFCWTLTHWPESWTLRSFFYGVCLLSVWGFWTLIQHDFLGMKQGYVDSCFLCFCTVKVECSSAAPQVTWVRRVGCKTRGVPGTAVSWEVWALSLDSSQPGSSRTWPAGAQS